MKNYLFLSISLLLLSFIFSCEEEVDINPQILASELKIYANTDSLYANGQTSRLFEFMLNKNVKDEFKTLYVSTEKGSFQNGKQKDTLKLNFCADSVQFICDSLRYKVSTSPGQVKFTVTAEPYQVVKEFLVMPSELIDLNIALDSIIYRNRPSFALHIPVATVGHMGGFASAGKEISISALKEDNTSFGTFEQEMRRSGADGKARFKLFSFPDTSYTGAITLKAEFEGGVLTEKTFNLY